MNNLEGVRLRIIKISVDREAVISMETDHRTSSVIKEAREEIVAVEMVTIKDKVGQTKTEDLNATKIMILSDNFEITKVVEISEGIRNHLEIRMM